MLAQLPSNMLITRIRPSIYLPACVAVWSCVSASTAAAQNYGNLIVIRFFLGIVEAPFFPGVSHKLTSQYNNSTVYGLTRSSPIGILPSVMLVHPKRASLTYRRFILWPCPRNRVFRLDCSWCVLRPGWGRRHTGLAMALYHRRRRQFLCCNGFLFPASRLHRIQNWKWQVALYRR